MARRRWRRVWLFLAAGFVQAIALAFATGLPLAPGRWPVQGAFGAFTWTAWFVASGLGFTLLFLSLAMVLGRRRGEASRPSLRRVLLAAATFGLLAVAAFVAAARADQIAQHPLPALALAVVALLLVRALTVRLADVSQ